MEGGRGVRGVDCLVFDEDVRALVVLSGSKEVKLMLGRQFPGNVFLCFPTVLMEVIDGEGGKRNR